MNYFNIIEQDLAINTPYVKGFASPVKNCWHFSTDGNSVECFFNDEKSFISGMNRTFFLQKKYKVTNLAFALMDTHIHFVLHGEFDECNKFVHEYVRQTSIYLNHHAGLEKQMQNCKISYQEINDDAYLKTCIGYVLRNPIVAGLPYLPIDYPWSSGSLYFRNFQSWAYKRINTTCRNYTSRQIAGIFHTHEGLDPNIHHIGEMIDPAEYVAVELVEKIFRTPKSYFFFLGRAKEAEVEARGGIISNLSIPILEMRQNKRQVCDELFACKDIRKLDTRQRILLARTLKSRYNSSPKQIARLCGLVYHEVKDILG